MTRSIDILEIGPNDDLIEVIRKCNYNFRHYIQTQESDDGSIVRVQDDVDEVKKTIAEQVDKILTLIKETAKAQDSKISNLEKKITNIQNELVPDVGSWIFADYDPNSKYPGTTWEHVNDPKSINAPLWHRTK